MEMNDPNWYEINSTSEAYNRLFGVLNKAFLKFHETSRSQQL